MRSDLIGYGVNRYWVGTSVPVSGCHGLRSDKARFGTSACGKRSCHDRRNEPADATMRRPVVALQRPRSARDVIQVFGHPSPRRTSRGPRLIGITQTFVVARGIPANGIVAGRWANDVPTRNTGNTGNTALTETVRALTFQIEGMTAEIHRVVVSAQAIGTLAGTDR